MRLPVKKVNVLGDRYRVFTHRMSIFGDCNSRRGEIRLRPNQTEDQARDTLLHEVIHAIDHVYSLRISEHQTRTLATSLRAVFTSNPEFARWVSK